MSKRMFCLSAQVCSTFSLARMYLDLLVCETTIAFCSISGEGILWLQMSMLFNHERTRFWIRESISKRKVSKASGTWLHNSILFHLLNENGTVLKRCICASGVYFMYTEVQWYTLFSLGHKAALYIKRQENTISEHLTVISLCHIKNIFILPCICLLSRYKYFFKFWGATWHSFKGIQF